jgi:hypothetical protein
MASISNVLLRIFEGVPAPGQALVQVSYTLTATLHDAPHQQSYRELVQLLGDDEGAGEDGHSELIPNGTIFDGTVTFSTSAVAFTQSHERTIPVALLDEDPGPFIRADEIRARVTLTALPAASPRATATWCDAGGRWSTT